MTISINDTAFKLFSSKKTTGWQSCDFPIESRRDFACVRIDSHRFIICGGQNRNGSLDSCCLWDCEKNTSSQLPSLPVEMAFCRGTMLNNYVYIMGSHKYLFRMHVDKMRSGWETNPATEYDPGYGHAFVTCNGKIYLIGGILQPTTISCFDPRLNKWEQKADMPIARSKHNSVVVKRGNNEHEIYVIGGRSQPSNQVLETVHIYSENDDTWRIGPDIPSHGVELPAVTAIENNILVLGGHSGCSNEPIPCILHLDTSSATSAWKDWDTLRTQLPCTISGHVAAATDFKVYIVGGVHYPDGTYNTIVYGCDFSVLLGRRPKMRNKMNKFEGAEICGEIKTFFCCKERSIERNDDLEATIRSALE